MEVAHVIAQRSACSIAQVGCVIVDATNRIVATGYNGPPSRMSSERWLGQAANCVDDCPRALTGTRTATYGHACISIHAEANALLFCDRREREGGTLYSSAVACADCQKLVANSGVARVVQVDDGQPHRSFNDMRRFLTRSGLIVEKWELPL